MNIETDSFLWPAFTRVKHPLYGNTLVTFVKGEGAYLYDLTGKRYFDGFSTLWTNLVGHGRDEIIDAMVAQMRSLSFMHLFSGTQHEPALRLSKLLTEISPFRHRYCFFGCSGSDATETAIKMARAYWYHKGRMNKNIIIGRAGGYHGTSLGALSLMGSENYRKPYMPLAGNIYMVPPSNCFRCPFEALRGNCNRECYFAFVNIFKELNAENRVAAILIEPVITSNGLITPPVGYWDDVQKLCDDHEVLLIADEVSTGMGRCGSLYASSLYNIRPNIVYLAKSLTSGYAPLSAVMVDEDIYDSINDHQSFFTHGSTFAGHPAACVAAEKVINILNRDMLIQHANVLGKVLDKTFRSELMHEDCVGNIRGVGTLYEIELVCDKKSNNPPSDEIGVGMQLYADLLRNGVYLRVMGRFICVAPPLIASADECVEMVGRLKKSLRKVTAMRALW